MSRGGALSRGVKSLNPLPGHCSQSQAFPDTLPNRPRSPTEPTEPGGFRGLSAGKLPRITGSRVPVTSHTALLTQTHREILAIAESHSFWGQRLSPFPESPTARDRELNWLGSGLPPSSCCPLHAPLFPDPEIEGPYTADMSNACGSHSHSKKHWLKKEKHDFGFYRENFSVLIRASFAR